MSAWPIVIFIIAIIITIIAIILYYLFSPPKTNQVPWLIELLLLFSFTFDLIFLGVIAAGI